MYLASWLVSSALLMQIVIGSVLQLVTNVICSFIKLYAIGSFIGALRT